MSKINISLILDGIEDILNEIANSDLAGITNEEMSKLTAQSSYTKGILDSHIEFYGAKPNYSEAVAKLESIIKRCYQEAERRDKGF